MSTQWRDAAGELQTALGVTLSVVDAASGATLVGGRPPAVCGALLGAEPVPGLTCIARTEGEISDWESGPVHAECACGLQAVIVPVRFDGVPVCHIMVCGYSGIAPGREAIRSKLLARGVSETEAGSLVDAAPSIARERAEAAARVTASQAEALLRERVGVDERAARGCEIAMLAEVARDLSPAELLYGRIPQGPLRSLMRLTGSDHAVVQLWSVGDEVLAPAATAGDVPAQAVGELIDAALDEVHGTGRSFVSAGSDAEGRRLSVLGVPVAGSEGSLGALALGKVSAEALGADDVRQAELFAETLAAMLSNAHDFVDANVKLVELMQVNEVAQLLNSTLDHEKLAELSVEVLAKTLAFDVGGFVLDGFGEQRGRILHSVDLGRPDLIQLLADVWGADPAERLLEGVSVTGRSAALTEEGGRAGDWTLLTRELRFHNVRAGEVFVAAREPGAFDVDDERILGALAGHLSTALENAVLYGRLKGDFQRAIAALSALADATERLDRGHTDRVMDYAVSLGEEMGLSADRIGLLRFAGLLHDLGKVGIAEEILIKPTMLTDEEMELVRRHSEMGATIVEQVKLLEELTPIVRHHHEHWDGRGYPDGLAGEAIPLEARILAVADAYEAMTGKRHHRKRLPASAARIELERAAGSQFDPTVIRAFLALLDRRALMGSTGAYGVVGARREGPVLPA